MTMHSYFQQATGVNAVDLRDFIGAFWQGGDGVRASDTDGMKVSAQATPNMTVKVNAGWAKHSGYLAHNDSPVNVTIDTANASNPRIDLIVCRWRDQENGDPAGTDGADFFAVKGTPAATPSVPSLTGLACEKLAQVYVAAGATSIASAAITDARTLSSLAANAPTVTDWNTVITPGQYSGNAANGPTANSYFVNVSASGLVVQQTAKRISTTVTDFGIWHRLSSDKGATWTAWRLIAGPAVSSFVGPVSVTTNASGIGTFAHGLPFTPTRVTPTQQGASGASGVHLLFVSADATNVTIKAFSLTTGAVFTGNVALVASCGA